jgi:hypothetical protein
MDIQSQYNEIQSKIQDIDLEIERRDDQGMSSYDLIIKREDLKKRIEFLEKLSNIS